MHRVFIAYHHAYDQSFKAALVRFATEHAIFEDWSVDIGDISDSLDDETIRRIIRDDYLRSSTVTIVLVGTGTKGRKHVDWEIYSSMHDGVKNKQSGILVITLPSTGCAFYHAMHEGEKTIVYPEEKSWINVDSREEYERRYPYLPARIIDNLVNPYAKVSVTNWDKLTAVKLRFLVDITHNEKSQCDYDLSRPMRRANA